jgi:hypothetical protein
MKEIEQAIRWVEEIRFQPNRTYWPFEKVDSILSLLRSIKLLLASASPDASRGSEEMGEFTERAHYFLGRKPTTARSIIENLLADACHIIDRQATLLRAYREKRAVDGMNGRPWDGEKHLRADKQIEELEKQNAEKAKR